MFVSHSKKDVELVDAIRRALERADVTPIFYSDFLESGHANMTVPAAEDIANLISESCAVFILLGQNVSELSHTQGWVVMKLELLVLKVDWRKVKAFMVRVRYSL